MKAKEKKKEAVSDFKIAKAVVETLDLHADTLVTVAKVGNFRKYLRDHSKVIGKEYVTKVVDNQLKITRLK